MRTPIKSYSMNGTTIMLCIMEFGGKTYWETSVFEESEEAVMFIANKEKTGLEDFNLQVSYLTGLREEYLEEYTEGAISDTDTGGSIVQRHQTTIWDFMDEEAA